MPLPRLGRVRDAGALNDHSDTDARIMDVPAVGLMVDALAGEAGHAPSKRQICRAKSR